MLAVVHDVLNLPTLLAPSPPPRTIPLDSLHSDLVYIVASKASPLAILSLSCASKRLNNLLSQDLVWSPLFDHEASWARAQYKLHHSWKKVYLEWLRHTIDAWKKSGRKSWPSRDITDSPLPPPPDAVWLLVKIALFGPESTGKTSLMIRISHEKFSSRPTDLASMGVAVVTKNDFYNLQLWDITSDQCYGFTAKSFYGSAHIGMFVIDSNTTESEVKEYLSDWLQDPRVRNNETPLIIVRTKSDLYGPNPSFMADKAFILNFVHAAYGAVSLPTYYLEVSSATGTGIQELINVIALYSRGAPTMPKRLVTQRDIEGHPSLSAALPWFKRVAYFY